MINFKQTRFSQILFVAIIILGCLSTADAQTSSELEFDHAGFQPNRDYLALQPFERLDTLSGNMIATIPIFTLPGNGGRDLQFELTYNTNSGRSLVVGNRLILAPWTFGVRGVPMRINNQAPPGSQIADNIEDTRGITPLIVMGDGAERGTMFRDIPDASSLKWLITSDVWKYNRTDRILYTPDGTTYRFDLTSGKLTNITDVFGNQVTFDWTVPNFLTVGQELGNGQSRTVTFDMNVVDLPTSATYLGRQWEFTYDDSGTPDQNGGELRDLKTPLNTHWLFTYETPPDIQTPGLRRMKTLKTPFGGTITYDYQWRQLSPTDGREFLVRRTMSGNAEGEDWSFDYAYSLSSGYSGRTLVVTPSAQLIYDYGRVNESGDPNWNLIDGGIGLIHSEVLPRTGGSPIQIEDRHYQRVPAIQSSPTRHFDAAELANVTVTRDNRVYTTDYAYDYSGSPLLLGNFHHPSTITERGEIGSDHPTLRTFTMTYAHPRLGDDTNPIFVVGLMASQRLESDGEVWNRCWTYESTTGFKTSGTEFGASCASAVTTTFAADPYGNVASTTDGNGKMTTYTYKYGRLKDTNTPLYAISREINPDGTVFFEEKAGRRTTFHYDALQRVTMVEPPAGMLPTTTVYSGNSTQTTRGTSSLTTTLDGFGRPIGTENSLGVRRTIRYDAEGRLVYDGYPFSGTTGEGVCPSTGDVGTCIDYDELGRTRRKTNPDGTFRTFTYGPGTVTIADENAPTGRPSTAQAWRAFGDPDSRRLVSVTDANGSSWGYSYHALGELSSVVATGGTVRIWTYNGQHRLSGETHPESGTTTYSLYDNAGNLKTKSTANGTTFQYTYDDNNRVSAITAGAKTTTISYEAGSDNRAITSDGTEATTLSYDTAGRPASRTEAIGPYVYTTTYGYDAADNVTSITYPTGRVVKYDVDSEHQITNVYETAPGPSYALGMTYHPSGAVATFTAGNGIATSITYDPQRYWVSRVTSGALDLTYGNYDAVGNVRTIGDSRSGYGQSFIYDALDRLSEATGPWGTSSYPYDVHGNRQTANGTSYTYDAHLWLVQQGTATFWYDANGNMTSGPNATYTYTPEDWLATATNGGTTTSYVYDADGWRARKISGPDTTLYLRGLHGELLTEWKNPGPTGHTKEYVYAGSRLLAAIDRDRSTLPTACGGNAIPDGSPHPITISTPGGSATVPFDGSACRQISIEVTTTSGNLGCPTISLIKPDGVTFQSWTPCGSSSFIDPVTLQYSGAYSVVVHAGATNTGSATVRIYDVVDRTSQIVPNGPAVTLASSTPGQRFKLTFDGVAGRRYGFLAEQLSGNCLFITVTVLNPNLTTLGNGSSCGTAPFFDPPVPTASGQFTILIDPSGSNTGTVRVTLYESVDLTDSITANGAAVTKTFTTPGQQLRLTFDGLANHRYAFLAEQLSGGTCLLINVTVLNPNGTTLGSGGSCGTAPFFEPPVPTATGTFTIVIDPSAATIGTARVTLYDVTDIADSITPGGAAVTKTFTTPGQKLRLTFDGVANHRYAFLAEQLSGGTCLLINVTVLNPNGTTLSNGGSCATAPFFEPPVPTATGTFTILIDPPAATIGTARVTLYDVTDITDSITPNGSAVTKTFTTPGQNLRLTFDGVANHRYAFLAEQVSGGTCLLINVTVLNPNGTTLGSGGSCATAPFFEPPVPTATGTFTILIDPPGATIGTARVTLYDEVDVTGSLTINGAGVPVSLTTPGQMARLTFDVTSTQQVTVRVTDGTIGFTTVRLLKPNGTEQTANSSSLGSFNLSTQTLTTPGTYTVVVDPSSTYTGNITVAVTSP